MHVKMPPCSAPCWHSLDATIPIDDDDLVSQMADPMDVGSAPTEYRVSTNGKINSYVDSALKALPVRRCLPPRASLRLCSPLRSAFLGSTGQSSSARTAQR